MSKLMSAMIAAGLCIGLNNVMAGDAVKSDTPAATEQNAGSPSEERRNRDSTQQQGDVTPGPGAGEHSGAGNDTSAPTGANTPSSDGSAMDTERNRDSTMQNESAGGDAVRSEDSAAQPSQPGDPTDEIRNRDSRKQQQDSGSAIPEPTQK
jgi:hypothetical protein